MSVLAAPTVTVDKKTISSGWTREFEDPIGLPRGRRW
jgi:hypothetical protein